MFSSLRLNRFVQTDGSRRRFVLRSLLALTMMASAATVSIATAAFAAGGWSSPTSIDPGNNLSAVSCPTTGFCVAADSDEDALTYNGATWSAPTDTGLETVAVSCVSAHFCAAVGGEPHLSTHYAMTYNGTTWTTPTIIDTIASGVLEDVTCATADFCVALDNEGYAMTYNGGSWSGATDILGDATSVSCPTVSFCVAIDAGQDAVTYNGTRWSAPSKIDSLSGGSSVSCASANFCMADTIGGDVLAYNGASWSSPVRLDIDTRDDNSLGQVSCSKTAPNICVAIEQYGTDAITYNGESWENPVDVDATGLTSVSCTSVSFCMGVDLGGDEITSTTAQAPLAVTTTSLPDGTVGTRYSATLAASGGNSPYSWKLLTGSSSLPKGLKLNKQTGVISGTPTRTASAHFTVEALDTKTKNKPHAQNKATATLSITISS